MRKLSFRCMYLVIFFLLSTVVVNSVFAAENPNTVFFLNQKSVTSIERNMDARGSFEYEYVYNSSSVIVITTDFGANFDTNVSVLLVQIEHLENTEYQNQNEAIYFQQLKVLNNANQSIKQFDLNNQHDYQVEVIFDLPRAYETLSVNISLKLNRNEDYFQIQTPKLTSEPMEDEFKSTETLGKQVADFLNEYQPLAVLSIVLIGVLWVIQKIRYWDEEDMFSLGEVRSMADPGLKRRIDLFLVMTVLSVIIAVYSVFAFMFSFTVISC